MVGSHIGHDCQLGNNLVIANNAAIAGHCIFDDDVIMEEFCCITIHKNWQRCNDRRYDGC